MTVIQSSQLWICCLHDIEHTVGMAFLSPVSLFTLIVIGVSNRITRTETETLLKALLILLLNNLGNQVRQVRDGYGRHIFGLTKEVGVTH